VHNKQLKQKKWKNFKRNNSWLKQAYYCRINEFNYRRIITNNHRVFFYQLPLQALHSMQIPHRSTSANNSFAILTLLLMISPLLISRKTLTKRVVLLHTVRFSESNSITALISRRERVFCWKFLPLQWMSISTSTRRISRSSSHSTSVLLLKQPRRSNRQQLRTHHRIPPHIRTLHLEEISSFHSLSELSRCN